MIMISLHYLFNFVRQLLHVCTAISLMNMMIYECTSQKSFTRKPLVNKLRLIKSQFFFQKKLVFLEQKAYKIVGHSFSITSPAQIRQVM